MSANISEIPTQGKIKAMAANFGKRETASAPAPAPENKRAFISKTANAWMQEAMTKPVPRRYFGDLVIENEITVLFASTNVGKSILAVQIAQSIASGRSDDPFPVYADPQPVLYADFELSGRQFTGRYSRNNGSSFYDPFEFSPNFIRLENDYADPAPGQSMAEYYISAIAEEVDRHAAKVVIIDNVTWINSKLEKAADAAPFMQLLVRLKREKDLTILLLAHTPKRDATRPIDIYDLQGSAMVSNFIDSAFAIGRSKKDPAVRYVKQVKCRDGEIVFDGDNVAVCALEKDGNFLGYRFQHFEPESEHLKGQTDEEKDEIADKVLTLHGAGKSYREIGKELGVSHMKAKRIVERNAKDNPAWLGNIPEMQGDTDDPF